MAARERAWEQIEYASTQPKENLAASALAIAMSIMALAEAVDRETVSAACVLRNPVELADETVTVTIGEPVELHHQAGNIVAPLQPDYYESFLPIAETVAACFGCGHQVDRHDPQVGCMVETDEESWIDGEKETCPCMRGQNAPMSKAAVARAREGEELDQVCTSCGHLRGIHAIPGCLMRDPNGVEGFCPCTQSVES